MNILFRTVVSFLQDPDYRNLLFTTIVILGIGTVFYHFAENWSWIDALYFCVVTLTTIGYGDFSPRTELGKIFTIGYILLGIGI
ncbi:MAG: potassium channel family protein, partial [Cytophagales bacterium]